MSTVVKDLSQVRGVATAWGSAASGAFVEPSRRRLDMEAWPLLSVIVACRGVVTHSLRDTIVFHQAIGGLGEGGAAPARPLRIGAFVDAPGDTPSIRRSVRPLHI